MTRSNAPPIYRTLPQRFAVFDERLRLRQIGDETTDDMYNRYKIYDVVQTEVGTAEIIPRVLDLFVDYDDSRVVVMEGEIKDQQVAGVMIYERGRSHLKEHVLFWSTFDMVYLQSVGDWIPVLDFSSDGPFIRPFTHFVEGDTLEWLHRRRLRQRYIREKVLNPYFETGTTTQQPPQREPPMRSPPRAEIAWPVPQPSAPPPPPLLTAPAVAAAPPKPKIKISLPMLAIPKFVAEALKRDAIQKEESCAISMMEIKDCEQILMTSCYHLFEAEAIATWLSSKPTCPTCKQKVSGVLMV